VPQQLPASNTALEFLLEVTTKLKPIQIYYVEGIALLTPCERDVARLAADGLRTQEISCNLNLREYTVRNFVFRIFESLGISSRVELVLYGLSGPKRHQAPERSRAGANHNSSGKFDSGHKDHDDSTVANSLRRLNSFWSSNESTSSNSTHNYLY
jgi:DNA-binding CsgD family transcriptional regulator